MKVKFLFPLLGLILGIFLSSDIFEGWWISIIFFGLAMLAWLLIFIISKDPLKGFKVAPYHCIWIFLLFAGLGSLDYNFFQKPALDEEIAEKTIVVNATIEEVTHSTNGDKFKIKIKSLKEKDKYINFSNLYFFLNTDGFIGEKGDNIVFTTKPKKIDFRGKKERNSRDFKHKGISYFANAHYDKINNLGKNNSIQLFFSDLRDNLSASLENSSLNRETSDFLISLLLGNKSFISTEVRHTLNSAGLAHILAVSGLHIAILLSILLFIFFPLSLLGFHKTRKILAIIFIWFYVILTGGSPSTIRAAIMASFVIFAFLLERKNSSFNALLGAATFILLFDPLALWEIGFQLSFICVASIIIFTDKLNPIDHHLHPKSYTAFNLILISIITTFCTWIITAYYFKTVPILFIPANIILLPLLPLFMGSGMLYLILISCGLEIPFLSEGLNKFFEYFIDIAGWLSFNGRTSINLNVSPLSVILWIGLIFLFYLLITSNSRKIKKFTAIGATFLFLSSVASLFVMSDNVVSTIKFKHSFSQLLVEHKAENNIITQLQFPRNNISSSFINNTHLIAVDCYIHPDSLNLLVKKNNVTNRYLIIGAGSDTQQMAQLINDADFSKIILHAGIGKNKKMELFHLLEESNLDKIYSLRDNGSLEFDL